VYSGIAIDTVPALIPADIVRLASSLSGVGPAFDSQPTLTIVPTIGNQFVLAYRLLMSNAITCLIDANTGHLLRTYSSRKDAIGIGTGVLGDVKKISTTFTGGEYRTVDTLRPSTITTLNTQSSEDARNRLLSASVQDGDYPEDTDDVWSDGAIVDAHVNSGLTFDYFFKRQQWSGIDGHSGPMTSIVDSTTQDNAFFEEPPFGPDHDGAAVFGATSSGVPVTSLDVVGHELMHGVTYFSVDRRTGTGLLDWLVTGEPGPMTFDYEGTRFGCTTTVLVYGPDDERPFVCDSAGRFVLVADEPGAINEGFSDVFGSSVEFFYQPPGDGPLKADYLNGEDVRGFGPTRSSSNPASLAISTDDGSVPYPNHTSRMLRFAVVVAQGPPSNPTAVSVTPVAFVNGQQMLLFNEGEDDGGVHWNSTVISHAYYLAIEGGRNATSGLSVTGVGEANRNEIERIFFRAMTELMPDAPTFRAASVAISQAAIDLYGANSQPAQSIDQALAAVGLGPA
jgi:Zn-dependent metalloprotease